MSPTHRTAVALTVALLAPGSAARAGVIQVPGDYLNLQVAVNNAVDGDVILIDPGTYAGPVDISDKSLTLVVETGGAIVPRIAVHDLSANKTVILRGLGGDGAAFAAGPNLNGLQLTGNAGYVVVEGSTLHGGKGYEAVRVTGSAHVAFTHCTILGGTGARGLTSIGSDVSIIGSSVTAGPVTNSDIYGDDGPSAIAHTEGELYVSGCTLVGADGGLGWCDFEGLAGWTCGSGGNGGACIQAWNQSFVWVHGNTYVPGLGKPGGDDEISTFPGVDAHALDLSSGGAVVTTLHDPARDTSVTAVVPEGQAISLAFDGEPEDFALVWVSLAPRWELLPAYAGVFQVDNGAPFNVLIPVASTGATGALNVSFTAPALVGGLDALTLHLQGLFKNSSGQFRLGPRTVLVLVDAAL